MLRIRLELGIYTTEDSIRYSLFLSVLNNSQLKAHNFIQEFPHPKLNRAKIDTWITDNNHNTIAIEFKYHRAIPSGGTTPKPQRIGKAFRDISRLGTLESDAYFIHLADAKTVGYMSREVNGLTSYFNCKQDDLIHISDGFYEGKCQTFLNNVGAIFKVDLICRCASTLPNGHSLRIYQIKQDSFGFLE